jgi:hypothetical protein
MRFRYLPSWFKLIIVFLLAIGLLGTLIQFANEIIRDIAR